MTRTSAEKLGYGSSYRINTCKVMNAPCSFGNVCSVESSFCPRFRIQSKPFTLEINLDEVSR